MRIIFSGDLHCKEKQPFQDSCLSFLDWTYEKYGDDIIIHGGDLFDSSSHHHELVFKVTEKLKKFKDFRIVIGNHDKSKIKGSILESLKHYPNITVYDSLTEFEIDDIKFIALPSLYHSEKDYENIEGLYDYSLSHFTPVQEAFNNEGVELKFKVNVAHIFAHIHRHAEYIDNFGNQILISGSVVNTRLGEQDWDKYIFELKKDGYEKIELPKYHSFVEWDYDSDLPENKNDIYILNNCPSKMSALDKFKNYYIHSVNLKVKNQEEYELEDGRVFSDMSSKEKFDFFSKEKNYNEDIRNYIFNKMDEVGL